MNEGETSSNYYNDTPVFFLLWIRSYWFVVTSLTLLILYSLFILPENGVPTGVNQILVILFVVLSFSWLLIILTDRNKSEWIKSSAVILLLFTSGWLFYRYSGANWKLLNQQFFNFASMRAYWHVLFQALGVTFQLALTTFIISPIVGIILAVFRSFNNRIINGLIIGFIDLFRSIPDIVLVVVVYYALPYIGIELGPLTAATVALSLLYGAYSSEVFRSGIESIHRTQIEASRALGLTGIQTMRWVILPQAIRVVIPPLTSLMVELLKSTAISSVVAVPELMHRARQLNRLVKSVTPLFSVAMIYLIVISPFVILSNRLEKKFGKWSRKGSL